MIIEMYRRGSYIGVREPVGLGVFSARACLSSRGKIFVDVLVDILVMDWE